MDERHPGNAGVLPEDEEEVSRLLAEAGPRPDLPEEDLAAIWATARSAWQREVRPAAVSDRPRAPRSRLAVPLALAAALFLALGVGWWWSRGSRGVPGPAAWVTMARGSVRLEGESRSIGVGEKIPLGATLVSGGEAGSEGRAALQLVGGASVRLDVGTRLELAETAELELTRGAVYVDTGAGRPAAAVVVRSPLGTARDVGTRFTVRLEGSEMRVQVRDGAVEVEHRGGVDRAGAGEELVVHAGRDPERRQVAGYGPQWAWTWAAAPRFEGRRLDELLLWVERETGWQVRYADEGLARAARQIDVFGVESLRPDQAPFVVLPGAGWEAELAGKTLHVRRRR